MQRETPHKFDEIRCYEPKDFPMVFQALLNDPMFLEVVHQLPGSPSTTQFIEGLAQCKTSLDFQKRFIYSPLRTLMQKVSDGVSMDIHEIKDKSLARTFISNHRDIVLDPALLSLLLIDNGFSNTQEIAIGDNLLVYPWIKHFVRLNKAFIVKRSASFRETLLASRLMSEYMHFVLKEKHNSIWIAQREGRAKDSNDKTQEAVLKMIAMGHHGSPQEALLSMNITPLSICYEYDPCDYLKAKEFQLKRDDPNYRKTPQDDLLNMQTGIMGYKGRVKYSAAPEVNDWIQTHLQANKTTFFKDLATHIDHEIYRRYTFYPGNYVAADLLEDSTKRHSHYSREEKQCFSAYIQSRIDKIDLPHKDIPFLTMQLLKMYANPLLNHEKVLE